MTAGRPVHGLVHGRPGLHPEIPLVAIHRLAGVREIDPAVMERRGGGLEPADELVVPVHEDVEFIPEVGCRSFLRPGAVAAAPRLCLLAPGRVRDRR